jgi:acetyl esterase/lipase
MRREWDALFSTDPAEAELEAVTAGTVPCAWITAPGASRNKVLVYFHGGGFRVGSIASHRGLMARLSAAAGCAVLGVDYRLAPEHTFPAPLQDALAVYDWLLPQVSGPASIALAGDSAGGGLALSTLLSLRDAGRALPAACLLMSPWTDLTASGDSYRTRAESDPIHQRRMILAMAKGYLGSSGAPTDPLASPLFGDVAGLPPLLIQVGDRETVLDDSRRLSAIAEAAGVPTKLEVWDGMIHVFQLFAADLPEAREAIASAGSFLLRALAGTPVGANEAQNGR